MESCGEGWHAVLHQAACSARLSNAFLSTYFGLQQATLPQHPAGGWSMLGWVATD